MRTEKSVPRAYHGECLQAWKLEKIVLGQGRGSGARRRWAGPESQPRMAAKPTKHNKENERFRASEIRNRKNKIATARSRKVPDRCCEPK